MANPFDRFKDLLGGGLKAAASFTGSNRQYIDPKREEEERQRMKAAQQQAIQMRMKGTLSPAQAGGRVLASGPDQTRKYSDFAKGGVYDSAMTSAAGAITKYASPQSIVGSAAEYGGKLTGLKSLENFGHRTVDPIRHFNDDTAQLAGNKLAYQGGNMAGTLLAGALNPAGKIGMITNGIRYGLPAMADTSQAIADAGKSRAMQLVGGAGSGVVQGVLGSLSQNAFTGKLPGAIAKPLANSPVGRTLAAGGFGAAQNYGQNFGENAIARFSYDPTRDVNEGAGLALLTGGLMSAGGAGMHEVAQIPKVKAKTDVVAAKGKHAAESVIGPIKPHKNLSDEDIAVIHKALNTDEGGRYNNDEYNEAYDRVSKFLENNGYDKEVFGSGKKQLEGILSERRDYDRRKAEHDTHRKELEEKLMKLVRPGKLGKNEGGYIKLPGVKSKDPSYYHGTLENFDTFDNAKIGSNTGYDNTQLGHFFLQDKNLAKQFVNDTKVNGDTRKPRVVEARLNIKKPIDLTEEGILSNKQQAADLYEALSGKRVSADEALANLEEASYFNHDFVRQIHETPNLQEKLKAKGYDGAVSLFGSDEKHGAVKETIAFDAKQIDQARTPKEQALLSAKSLAKRDNLSTLKRLFGEEKGGGPNVVDETVGKVLRKITKYEDHPINSLNKEARTNVEDYASYLSGADKMNRGGQMVPDGEGGYKRITQHSPFYSQFYKEHGKAPTKRDWAVEAHRQLESGKADETAVQMYTEAKNAPAQRAIKYDEAKASGFQKSPDFGNSLVNEKPIIKAGNSEFFIKQFDDGDGQTTWGLVTRNTKDGHEMVIGRHPSEQGARVYLDSLLQEGGYKPAAPAPLPTTRPAPKKITPSKADMASLMDTEPALPAPRLPLAQPKAAPQQPIPQGPHKPQPTLIREGDATDFHSLTNRHQGEKANIETKAVLAARDLPKLKPADALEAIRHIDAGTTSKDEHIQAVVDQFREKTDELYEAYKESGAFGDKVGYQEDYLPRIYKDPRGNGEAVTGPEFDALILGTGRAKGRTSEQLKEDALVSKDPRELMRRYITQVERQANDRAYLNDLVEQGHIVASGDRPQGMQVVDAPGMPEPKTFTTPDGQQIQGKYYATPEVAKDLNRLFSPDVRGKAGKFVGVTAKISSKVQDVTMSGGLPGTPLNSFGMANWNKQALSGHPVKATQDFFRSFSAKSSDKFFTKNSDYITRMQSEGVPFRSSINKDSLTGFREAVASATGVRGKAKEAFSQAWTRTMNDPTFARLLPALQLDTFKQHYDHAIKKGLTEAQASKQAAEATRNAFGLNTLGKEALKSKVGNDAFTTVFFAPKFRESMLNFWVNNGKALGHPTDPRYRDNVKFMLGAGVLFAAMQGAQYAISGHSTLENENPNDRLNLSIPTGEGNAISLPFLSSIATLPRMAVNTVTDVATGKTKEAGLEAKKLMSQITRPIADLATNQKYNGKPIYYDSDSTGDRLKDQGAYTVGQFNHPWVRAGIDAARGKAGALETAATATELPVRFRDAYKPAAGKEAKANQDDLIKAAFSDKKGKEFLALKTDADKKAAAQSDPEMRKYYENYQAMKKATGSSTDLYPVDMDPKAQKTLERYDRMTATAKDKAFDKDNKAELEYEKAKFERDYKDGKLSRTETINRQSELDKLEVGSDYPKEIRDIFSLNKQKVYSLISSDKDGNRIAKQLLAYGDALESAGIRDNPFRDSKGNVAFAPKLKGSGSGKKFSLPKSGVNYASNYGSLTSLLKSAKVGRR